MNRPRVLLDVDGVLCDFLNPCLRIINNLMGTSHTLDHMTSWHVFEALGVPADVEKLVYDEMKTPGWCRKLPVYPEAIEGVRMLRDIADVYVCTSPMNGETWVHERERWCMAHFGFTRKDFVHTEAKYTTAADVLVDDKTETVVRWSQHFPDGLGIRFSQVTNKFVPFDGLTIDSWWDVYQAVASMNVPVFRRWTRPEQLHSGEGSISKRGSREQ